MAHVRRLTNAITGTGTVALSSGNKLIGGFALNTDGTNAGVIILRDGSVSGDILVDRSSVTNLESYFPLECKSGSVYYDISGTNADAQLYEWVSNIKI
jgi:hypothetical protein